MENINNNETIKKTIETILFITNEPVDLKTISKLINSDEQALEPIMQELILDYGTRGLQIIKVAGGYQIATRPEFADLAEKVFSPVKDVRLSAAALETLAIIAYRQPITRPEIEYLRGVDCDGVIELLEERELIIDLGRKDSPGRPRLYGTTSDFLRHFGLKDLSDLPIMALANHVIPSEKSLENEES